MTPFRRFAAFLALTLGFTLPASATTTSTDFTDLWWNSSESGWGFNVIHQGNTLFGTLFVYGTDQSARWYVADAMVPQAASAGTFIFKSKFYQTSGPYFGAVPFNPAATVTEVGEATITFPTATTATLVYNVGTTTITKQLTRQTFRSNTTTGQYIGGMTAITSSCANSGNNGLPANIIGDVVSTFNGTSVTFRVDYVLQGNNAVCNFAGLYSQQGRLGTVTNGSWSCAIGTTTLNNGTFALSQVDVQVNGLYSNILAADQICAYTGRFGGLRNANN